MKKILMMCCLFLGITAVSYAQQPGNGGAGRGFGAEQRAKRLQTQLKLTDEQTAKIVAIYKEQGTKLDSLRAANAPRDQFRPAMEAGNQKVKTVLTAEQNAEWDKMQKERRERGRQGGNDGGTPPPPPPAPPAPQK